MSEQLRSILVGTLGFDVVLLLALGATLVRGPAASGAPGLRRIARLAAAAVALQAAHFAEELSTGFHQRFPELLGLAAWPLGFFVGFNLAWLAIWLACIPALPHWRRAALFPLWLLGLGGALNLLAHPLLALRAGGYFPGLATAPLVGAVGLALLRRLARETAGGDVPRAAGAVRPG